MGLITAEVGIPLFYFDQWNHTIKNPVLNYKYYRIISDLHIDFYVETWYNSIYDTIAKNGFFIVNWSHF